MLTLFNSSHEPLTRLSIGSNFTLFPPQNLNDDIRRKMALGRSLVWFFSPLSLFPKRINEAAAILFLLWLQLQVSQPSLFLPSLPLPLLPHSPSSLTPPPPSHMINGLANFNFTNFLGNFFSTFASLLVLALPDDYPSI